MRRQRRGLTKKRPQRLHVVDTQTRSLEEACDIIAAYQKASKISATRKAKKIPLTLRQELSANKLNSVRDKRLGLISLAGGHSERVVKKREKRPHPFRDLPEQEKRVRAREMFRSGAWGIGTYGTRELSVAFGVSEETMALWLTGVIALP
jgi:hypothetical protein